jgi:hypothetical protein
MSWPVGKCPNKERSDQFSLIGKQKKIPHLIAGHPVGHLFLRTFDQDFPKSSIFF